LRVVARIKANSDKASPARELLRGLIEPTPKESGCITYQLLQNRKDPTDFTFGEEGQNDYAFDAHLSSDHIKKVLPQGEGTTAEPTGKRTYSVVG